MATPSLSATFNFVKKYPITLCGFSLLFMPSIHRLLLYFTPLLLSTAIFIVAMMSWGPSVPSDQQSTTRRSKPKLVIEHHEWAFNDSLGMDEEEEEEEEEDEEEDQVDTKVFHDCKASMDLDKQEITQKGEVEPDEGLKLREPEGGGDGDAAAEMASSGANCQAEPDPDLAEEEGDTAEEAASGADCQAGTGAPACQGVPDHAGTPASQAEPDPDLQGDGVGAAAKDDNAGHHVETDVHDGDAHAQHASHGMGHPHQHKHMQEGVPAERLPDYLQVCA